jgi:fructokinase
VIKLSAADAEWLYPGVPDEGVLDLILERGARLAVLTLGEHGALARSGSGRARSASPQVDVVDTVGAGDAFGAGLLRWLWKTDRLGVRAVGDLDDAELADALAFATAVAALQCTRAGATPPTLDEVETFLREVT